MSNREIKQILSKIVNPSNTKFYVEELVREFHASYVVTLDPILLDGAAPSKQAPLDHIGVRGKRVDTFFPSSASIYMTRLLMPTRLF